MMLTGKNRSTWRKTCPTATLFTTNPTSTELGSNPALRVERPAATPMSHCTAFKTKIDLNSNIRFLPRGKHTPSLL
jgi:hypothetical protein